MLRRSGGLEAAVWIPADVEHALEREAARCAPLETGGVLLGYEDAEERSLLQLRAMVGPGPKAIHLRDRFEPDSEWQRDRIATIYRESGHIVTYLGDWHSHPQGSKHPSRLDRRTARNIARCAGARIDRPLMVIASRDTDKWLLCAYRYERRRLRAADLFSHE